MYMFDFDAVVSIDIAIAEGIELTKDNFSNCSVGDGITITVD